MYRAFTYPYLAMLFEHQRWLASAGRYGRQLIIPRDALLAVKSPGRRPHPPRFHELDLGAVNLSHVVLYGVSFAGSNLAEASFAHAELRRVSFAGCDLTGTDFRGASLDRVDFDGANTCDALFDPEVPSPGAASAAFPQRAP